MKTKQLTFIDKSKWDDGPWMKEPDKLQWQDTKTGLPCLALRHDSGGHWCGYVGISKNHPYFEKSYDEGDHLDVHGGLTFSDKCASDEKERGVCHIVEPGENDNVWWLGFDCAHHMDEQPGMIATLKSVITSKQFKEIYQREYVYKTLKYVKRECRSLAKQLQEVADGS